MKEFFEAINKGDLTTIFHMRNDIDINQIDAEKQVSPLGLAVIKGEQAVVRLLLAFKNIDVNQATLYFDRTTGQTSIITPLGLAVIKNKPDILRILLAQPNINPDQPILHTHVTPLMQAIAQNCKECVNELYTITNPEHKDVMGRKASDYIQLAEIAEKRGYASMLAFERQHYSTQYNPTQTYPTQTYLRQPYLTQSYPTQSYLRQPSVQQPSTRTALLSGRTNSQATRNHSGLSVSSTSTRTVHRSELTSLQRRIEELEEKCQSQEEVIAQLQHDFTRIKEEQQIHRTRMQNFQATNSFRKPSTTNPILPTDDHETLASDASSETITRTPSPSNHPFFDQKKASISFLLNQDEPPKLN